jgi:hypothetical protein
MPPKKNNKSKNGNGGTLGIENELWEIADEVRANQIVSILPRFNPGKKFKDAMKTIEYVRGTVVSEPAPEPEA